MRIIDDTPGGVFDKFPLVRVVKERGCTAAEHSTADHLSYLEFEGEITSLEGDHHSVTRDPCGELTSFAAIRALPSS